MTSRPPAHPASTSSLSLSTSLPESDSLSTSPRRQPKIASKTPAVHALQHQRPGLVSRNSDSSTKTLQPRHHLRNKSSSLVPTLSTLNVGTAPSPRQLPIMASHTTGTSSGAADLLRQAMTRYVHQHGYLNPHPSILHDPLAAPFDVMWSYARPRDVAAPCPCHNQRCTLFLLLLLPTHPSLPRLTSPHLTSPHHHYHYHHHHYLLTAAPSHRHLLLCRCSGCHDALLYPTDAAQSHQRQ